MNRRAFLTVLAAAATAGIAKCPSFPVRRSPARLPRAGTYATHVGHVTITAEQIVASRTAGSGAFVRAMNEELAGQLRLTQRDFKREMIRRGRQR